MRLVPLKHHKTASAASIKVWEGAGMHAERKGRNDTAIGGRQRCSTYRREKRKWAAIIRWWFKTNEQKKKIWYHAKWQKGPSDLREDLSAQNPDAYPCHTSTDSWLKSNLWLLLLYSYYPRICFCRYHGRIEERRESMRNPAHSRRERKWER